MSNRNNRCKQRRKKMFRSLIERIDSIGRRIQKRATGYQAALRTYLAQLYEIAREIENDFDQYKELISCPCLTARKRLREATVDDFTQYVAEAVVRRAFDGSEVSDSCISKYIGAVRHCTAEDVRPGKAVAKMQEWGGVEATYQRGRDAAKEKSSSTAADGDISNPKVGDKQQPAIVRTRIFGRDHFHITLERKSLRSLLKGQEGEKRYIAIECKGRDDEGFLIWQLVDNEDKHRQRGVGYDNDDEGAEDAA